jgi:hypothetical protein
MLKCVISKIISEVQLKIYCLSTVFFIQSILYQSEYYKILNYFIVIKYHLKAINYQNQSI